MAKVTSKRQITLPVDLCAVAQIHTGDHVECFVDRQGIISIVKKSKGAAGGILKDIKIDQAYTEDESLQSAID